MDHIFDTAVDTVTDLVDVEHEILYSLTISSTLEIELLKFVETIDYGRHFNLQITTPETVCLYIDNYMISQE